MEERVFYEGPGQIPPGKIAQDILLLIVGAALPVGAFLITDMAYVRLGAFAILLIGALRLLYHKVLYNNSKYVITSMKIQRESGIIGKRIELIELYKIHDIGYDSLLGRGVITIHSMDRTSPEIKLSVPNGRDLFDHIQKSLPEARERSKAGVRFEMD